MKKPILISMFLMFLMFISCSLEEEGPEAIQLEISAQSQLETYFQSDGSEDQNMDKLLYEIVETFEFDILNPSNYPNYIKLFKEYEEVHLSKLLSSSKQNELKSFEQDLKVRGEEYFACMMIPNIDVADFSLSPIIAPGVEVDYKGDDLLFGDIIVGWFYNEKGEKQLIHLDENLGTTIKRPLIIITNDDQTEAKVPKGPAYPAMVKSTSVTHSDFPSVDACMIEQRFESPGQSDVNFAFCARTYASGDIGSIYNDKLRDTNKEYLYDYLDCFAETESYYRLAENLLRIYMVSYEKDWNRSKKDVMFGSVRLVTSMVRMRYSSDYYVRTYAQYDEYGELDFLYGSTGQNLVEIDNGGLLFFSW